MALKQRLIARNAKINVHIYAVIYAYFIHKVCILLKNIE